MYNLGIIAENISENDRYLADYHWINGEKEIITNNNKFYYY